MGAGEDGLPFLLVLGGDKERCCIALIDGWTYDELKAVRRAWYETFVGGEWWRDDDIPSRIYSSSSRGKITLTRLREMRRQQEIADGTLTGRARCGRRKGRVA